mmetsp:Transcript_116427/g.324460  ORF Transcript_116427/g.324460 Transcript_116427/m.324460 type:complete len:227 (+) Transcript_116427:434-1114(+)
MTCCRRSEGKSRRQSNASSWRPQCFANLETGSRVSCCFGRLTFRKARNLPLTSRVFAGGSNSSMTSTCISVGSSLSRPRASSLRPHSCANCAGPSTNSWRCLLAFTKAMNLPLTSRVSDGGSKEAMISSCKSTDSSRRQPRASSWSPQRCLKRVSGSTTSCSCFGRLALRNAKNLPLTSRVFEGGLNADMTSFCNSTDSSRRRPSASSLRPQCCAKLVGGSTGSWH